jgi:hypothetical protein
VADLKQVSDQREKPGPSTPFLPLCAFSKVSKKSEKLDHQQEILGSFSPFVAAA